MKFHRITTLLVIAATVSLGAACSSDKTDDAQTSLSLIVGNQDPFYGSMVCAARKQAAELGASLDVQIPQTFDPSVQIPLVSGVQAKRPDALIIVPTDRTALVPPLTQIHADGTKIVTVDTSLDPKQASNIAVAQIGSDNVAGGAAAADDLAARIKRGKVLVISTQPGVSTLDDRARGFNDQLAKTPGIESLGVQYSNNDPSKASAIVTATLAAHPDLAGIFAANLASAQGAATGLRSAGAQGHVTIVGFDAAPPQVEQLKQGLVASLIVQKPAEMGRDAVTQAVNAVTGKEVTPTIHTGFVVATRDNLTNADIAPYVTPGAC